MLREHLSAFLIGNHLKILSQKPISRGFLWEVEKRREDQACLRCGSVNTVRAGKCTTTVREAPIRENVFWLKIHKHRMYCKDCKKTFTEPVSGIWPRRRSTQRFRKSVAQACGKMKDLATVSRDHKVSHGFAYQVYYEQLEIKLREHRNRMKWPQVLGIDEHFFRRRNGVTEFVTMFTDVKNKKMFEMVHGKDVKSLMDQVEQIPGREEVKVVVIDMSSSYKSFAKKNVSKCSLGGR
jgi:transposase